MDEIIQLLLGSLTIGTIVIYLGKVIINKGFDAALKTFENKLELLKIEHQIKYSRLHEERAEILKTMYGQLFQLEKKLAAFTTLFQGSEWLESEEKGDAAKKQLQSCIELFETNRIFFTSDFCDTLNGALGECRNVIIGMEKARSRGRMQRDSAKAGSPIPFKEGESPIDLWKKQEEAVQFEINKRRVELANDFRVIIGVEKKSTLTSAN